MTEFKMTNRTLKMTDLLMTLNLASFSVVFNKTLKASEAREASKSRHVSQPVRAGEPV